MANGSTACLITALYAHVQGRNAARTMVLSLGSAATGGIGVPAASNASNNTGWVGTNSWLVNGGSATFRATASPTGSFWYGRGGGGSTIDSYGTPFSGNLAGGYRYVQAPSAPQSVSVAVGSTSGTALVSWSAPADNGGTGVTGYRIEWATNISFTAGTGNKSVGAVSSDTVTGLTPGSTYYFRVAAINAVTTAASTWSTYSGTASVALLGGVKIADSANDSGFVSSSSLYGVQAYNEYNFVPASVRQYDAATSSWITSLGPGFTMGVQPEYLNGWGVYDSNWRGPEFFRSSTGWVVSAGGLLGGQAVGGPITSGSPLMQLPVGFRPTVALRAPVNTSSGRAAVRVDPNGLVSLSSGTVTTGPGTWISFANLNFNDTLTYTNMALVSPWVANAAASWGNPRYASDPYGVVALRGQVSGGTTNTTAWNSPIVPVLGGAQAHVSASTDSGSGSGYWNISDTSPYPLKPRAWTSGSGVHLGTTSFYSNAGALTWTAVSAFSNSWQNYGGAFPGAAYTKRPDGIVMLRGLVASGTLGQTVFTLPAGFRPHNHVMWSGIANEAHIRIDILNTGPVVFSGGSNAWVALDGIMFASGA
jgi:hypothetical protein